MKARLLIVDDDVHILAALRERFLARGYQVDTAGDGDAALRAVRQQPDAVILDLQLPRRDGISVLQRLLEDGVETTVIVITAHGSVAKAVEAMKAGAWDFLEKPFEAARLEEAVGRAVERSRLRRRDRAAAAPGGSGEPIAQSLVMQELLATAKKAAASDATVLLCGESGTGKEVLAQAIHRWSPRAHEAFVATNCAAVAETLAESELFGHERGAFTGADKRQPGRIELAHRGTLFLDEVGELPVALQSKLLRVLQERAFERVGGRDTIHVDTRVVAATNRDLPAAVAVATFREDLFYRLAVIPLTVPPLRERRDDIEPLARAFVAGFGAKAGRVVTIADEALRRLRAHRWPGNVRELRNALERAVVLCEGEVLGADDLPPEVIQADELPPTGFHAQAEAYRRRLLVEALQRCGGSRTKAAELLGLQRTYLARMLRQYGLLDHV